MLNRTVSTFNSLTVLTLAVRHKFAQRINTLNMKSILFSLVLLCGTTELLSQQLTKDVFLGTWKVVNSQLIPEMEMGLDEEGLTKMEQMRIGLI